jgi:hypothetical protein
VLRLQAPAQRKWLVRRHRRLVKTRGKRFRIEMPLHQVPFVAILLTACMLACLPLAFAQDNPSASTMAQMLLDPDSFTLVTSGQYKPSFSGPVGSSKLIKYWAPSAQNEKTFLPDGGVKFTIPGKNGKSATATLKFSAISKVCRVSVLLPFIKSTSVRTAVR